MTTLLVDMITADEAGPWSPARSCEDSLLHHPFPTEALMSRRVGQTAWPWSPARVSPQHGVPCKVTHDRVARGSAAAPPCTANSRAGAQSQDVLWCLPTLMSPAWAEGLREPCAEDSEQGPTQIQSQTAQPAFSSATGPGGTSDSKNQHPGQGRRPGSHALSSDPTQR
jgi:hypothetical protein